MKAPISLRIDDWKQLVELNSLLNYSYIFRGHANSEWQLISSLERVMLKYFPLPLPELCYIILANREHWMLHEFKRKFHLYSQDRPKNHSDFEWLAIMQHHGAPTRLLDFTHSIYIASYFATHESSTDSSIMCLNVNGTFFCDSVSKQYGIKFKGSDLGDSRNKDFIKLLNKHIGVDIKCSYDFVLPIEPIKVTRRLSMQQGLFLAPLNPRKSFMQNIISTYNLPDDKLTEIGYEVFVKSNSIEEYSFIKLLIPKAMNWRIMCNLRSMNITRETLFPDLDGFSKSLIETVIRDEGSIKEIYRELKDKNK